MTVMTTLPAAKSVAEILAIKDLEPVELEMPEWGYVVQVRGFTREEGLKWSALPETSPETRAESDAFVVQAGLVEPSVTLEEAREIVAKKSQATVGRLIEKVFDLSGIATRSGGEGR